MEIVISVDEQKKTLETKEVKIDGLGSLTARRIGAGEGLDLSLKLNRKNHIISELYAMDIDSLKTKKDIKKLEAYDKKMSELMLEATDITEYEYRLYRKCLTSKSKKVNEYLNSLTIDGLRLLMRQIFEPKKEDKDA